MTAPTVARCDAASLTAAARLFDEYRRQYGERADEQRAALWLAEQVRSGMLLVWTASVAGRPVGVATAHRVPASLAMGTFWQLRDLFVSPDARRQGAARTLVAAVRDAARADGAIRLSLVTEPDNVGALALYRRLGFERVEGLTTLSAGLR